MTKHMAIETYILKHRKSGLKPTKGDYLLGSSQIFIPSPPPGKPPRTTRGNMRILETEAKPACCLIACFKTKSVNGPGPVRNRASVVKSVTGWNALDAIFSQSSCAKVNLQT
jgi:hypothetical protein